MSDTTTSIDYFLQLADRLKVASEREVTESMKAECRLIVDELDATLNLIERE